MKKFLVILCVFFLPLSVSAQDSVKAGNVSVTNTLSSEGDTLKLNGFQFSNGDYDYHILPWSSMGNTAYAADDPNRKIVIKPSDPYIVEINKVKYILIKDNKDGVWDENDILGFHDSPQDLFASLKALNSKSEKIDSKDLIENDIRFAALGKNGKLILKDKTKDFDLKQIDYIDTSKLIKLANNINNGVFGHFRVYLKNKKSVLGIVTFSSNEDLKNLF